MEHLTSLINRLSAALRPPLPPYASMLLASTSPADERPEQVALRRELARMYRIRGHE